VGQKQSTRVAAGALRRFCSSSFQRVGVPALRADLVADTIVEASLRGVDSHGIALLPEYITRLHKGGWDPRAEPTVVQETSATALLDGNNGLGQITTVRAVEIAVAKASSAGTGSVGVRNSSHFGAAAYYAMLVAKEEMIGLVFTNASPAMAPWGGISPVMSNNPWSVAVPVGEELPVVMDLAMSVVARSKIRMAALAGERIPYGWALSKEGLITEDPDEALEGTVLPVGDYKGYAIALIVDILAGVLTGAAFGAGVGVPFPIQIAARHADAVLPAATYEPQHVGHLVIAINVEAFMPVARFKARMDELIRGIKASRLREGFEQIFMPGEREWLCRAERARDGIPISSSLLKRLEQIRKELGIEPLGP